MKALLWISLLISVASVCFGAAAPSLSTAPKQAVFVSTADVNGVQCELWRMEWPGIATFDYYIAKKVVSVDGVNEQVTFVKKLVNATPYKHYVTNYEDPNPQQQYTVATTLKDSSNNQAIGVSAAITYTNKKTNANYVAKLTAGEYKVNVPAGTYDIKVHASGYYAETKTNVKIAQDIATGSAETLFYLCQVFSTAANKVVLFWQKGEGFSLSLTSGKSTGLTSAGKNGPVTLSIATLDLLNPEFTVQVTRGLTSPAFADAQPMIKLYGWMNGLEREFHLPKSTDSSNNAFTKWEVFRLFIASYQEYIVNIDTFK